MAHLDERPNARRDCADFLERGTTTNNQWALTATFCEFGRRWSRDVVFVHVRELVLGHQAEGRLQNFECVAIVLAKTVAASCDVDPEPFERKSALVDRLRAVSG